MRNGITFDRASLNGVISAIDRLPSELKKSAEKAVLRAGAKPILSAVKGNLSGSPVKTRTGTLKKSMGLTVQSKRDGWVEARVGSKSGSKTKYAKGVTGRRTRGRQGKPLYAEEVAWYLEQGTSKMPAKPFIRPALDSAAPEVATAMANGLERHLTKVAARLART